jgi:hypothetical protein
MKLLKKHDEVFDKILELDPNFNRMTIKEMEQFKLSTELFEADRPRSEFFHLICELLELEKEILNNNK